MTTSKPTILIDSGKIKTPHCGVGQYTLQLAQELEKRSNLPFHLRFLVYQPFERDFRQHCSLDYDVVSTNAFRRCTHKVLPFLTKYKLPLRKPAIWHCLHSGAPWMKHSLSNQKILTIHDLNFLFSSNKPKKHLKECARFYRHFDRFIFISQFTKRTVDSQGLLNNQPSSIIYNGVNSLSSALTRPKGLKNEKFFFSIGLIHKKKNFHALVPMMRQFPDYKLLIAGEMGSPYSKWLESYIEKMELSDRVHLIGSVDESEKSWLYHHCEAFLFPSIAEGFGIPPIEAMHVGKPVFLSTHTSLPEIGGEEAIYWENFDPVYMSRVLRQGLENQTPALEARRRKRAAHFTWTQHVDSLLQLYEEALAESRVS